MAVVLFYSANVLYCLAYVVRDMVWLRTLTIIAAFATLPYFFGTAGTPLWSAIGWQAAFAGINLVNLYLLLQERRPADLTEDQQRLHELVFRGLTQRQAKELMELGEWLEVPPKTRLIKQGSHPHVLLLVSSGFLDVRVEGRLIAQITKGRFAAAVSFMSGDPAHADVVTTSRVRYLRWERDALELLMDRKPHFKTYLTALLSQDLVVKLRDTGTFVPGRDW